QLDRGRGAGQERARGDPCVSNRARRELHACRGRGERRQVAHARSRGTIGRAQTRRSAQVQSRAPWAEQRNRGRVPDWPHSGQWAYARGKREPGHRRLSGLSAQPAGDDWLGRRRCGPLPGGVPSAIRPVPAVTATCDPKPATASRPPSVRATADEENPHGAVHPMYVSRETPTQTEARLRRVIAAAELVVYDRPYAFE